MIKDPTEEIVFMNVMTLLCEYSGLRADKHYSIEYQNKGINNIPQMTLNENYTNISRLLEKVFKKEALLSSLLEELKNVLSIEINASHKLDVLWEEINDLSSLIQYIDGYINRS